jgi:hypothetical protein
VRGDLIPEQESLLKLLSLLRPCPDEVDATGRAISERAEMLGHGGIDVDVQLLAYPRTLYGGNWNGGPQIRGDCGCQGGERAGHGGGGPQIDRPSGQEDLM